MNFVVPCGISADVSRNAVLVFAVASLKANHLGISEAIFLECGVAGLKLDETQAALEELEAYKYLRVFNTRVVVALVGKNAVFDYRTDCQILSFEIPRRFERLHAKEWKELRTSIFERDDFTCQYCGARGVELECDHVEPISLGGTNEPGNLVTACKTCNRNKRIKLIQAARAS